MEPKPHPNAFLLDGEWWVTNVAAAWRWDHHPSIPEHLPHSVWHEPEEGYSELLCFFDPVMESKAVAKLVRVFARPAATEDDIKEAGWRFVALNPGYHHLIRGGSRSDVCIMQIAAGVSPAVRVYDSEDRVCALVMPMAETGVIGRDGRYLTAKVDRRGRFPQPPKGGGEE